MATSPFQFLVSPLVCLVLMTLLTSGQGQESQGEREVHASLVSRLDDVQGQLNGLLQSVEGLESELDKALIGFDCLATRSELCEAMEIEAGLLNKLGLQSHWRPGKRSNRLYKDLRQKRGVTQHLNRVFKDAGDLIKNEKKRSCVINMGFHCHTAELFEFMDYWDWLNSADSPGKKRAVKIPALPVPADH